MLCAINSINVAYKFQGVVLLLSVLYVPYPSPVYDSCYVILYIASYCFKWDISLTPLKKCVKNKNFYRDKHCLIKAMFEMCLFLISLIIRYVLIRMFCKVEMIYRRLF